jgi:hypothetical protein
MTLRFDIYVHPCTPEVAADRRRAKSDSSEGKREVFMSQLSHHLLLSYLGRPDITRENMENNGRMVLKSCER